MCRQAIVEPAPTFSLAFHPIPRRNAHQLNLDEKRPGYGHMTHIHHSSLISAHPRSGWRAHNAGFLSGPRRVPGPEEHGNKSAGDEGKSRQCGSTKVEPIESPGPGGYSLCIRTILLSPVPDLARSWMRLRGCTLRTIESHSARACTVEGHRGSAYIAPREPAPQRRITRQLGYGYRVSQIHPIAEARNPTTTRPLRGSMQAYCTKRSRSGCTVASTLSQCLACGVDTDMCCMRDPLFWT
ncbi:hypothetical protein B0H13DRAFT_1896275 [Mycena leptocephala]|nr:hypothetical protein B0H13DRAFT_1896275 [Mycena leptocephala]